VAGQPSLFGIDPERPSEEPAEPSDHAPLATRMRPRTFDEFVGQHRAIGLGTVLRRAVDAGEVPSLILWGPPGTGKTTLAVLIAGASGAAFEAVSATSAGVADLRKVVERARERLRSGRRTVLFIDEIHRFNKSQQDAVLPHVENATVTLLGATTENPSFEVNAALLSRSRVIRLEALEPDDIRSLIERALNDSERGLGGQHVVVDPNAIDRLVALCGGDARIALNSLELAVQAATRDPDGAAHVTVADIEGALQSPALLYDRAGDQHYWLISAFIKSVRGSDPDAAVYWLARMLEAGEDPLFVARRMVISAAEDIGLADPHALGVAVAAQQAAHFIGMPEGFLPLAEAALYLAAAPKSNSVLRAYVAASSDVAETLHQPVPLHLRNAVTGLGRSMGFGTGYRYAHDHEGRHRGPGAPPGVARRPSLLRAVGARSRARGRRTIELDPRGFGAPRHPVLRRSP
jgi:putative ATPase